MAEIDQISTSCRIPSAGKQAEIRVRKVVNKQQLPKSPPRLILAKPEEELKQVKSKYAEDSSSDYEAPYPVIVNRVIKPKGQDKKTNHLKLLMDQPPTHYSLRKRNPEGFTSFAYPAQPSVIKITADQKRKATVANVDSNQKGSKEKRSKV